MLPGNSLFLNLFKYQSTENRPVNFLGLDLFKKAPVFGDCELGGAVIEGQQHGVRGQNTAKEPRNGLS